MQLFNVQLLCGHVASTQTATGKLICPRCSEVDYPEGVLRKDYAIDGRYLTIEFSKDKGYYIGSHLRTIITKCNTLQQAEVMHTVLLHFGVNQWRQVVKLIKQIERNARNSRSINFDIMNVWQFSMHVLKEVEKRLQQTKPSCHSF